MLWERMEEDFKSIKSDVLVYLKRLKGNKYDDGMQSDLENVGVYRCCSKCVIFEEYLRCYYLEYKKLQKVQVIEKY